MDLAGEEDASAGRSRNYKVKRKGSGTDQIAETVCGSSVPLPFQHSIFPFRFLLSREQRPPGASSQTSRNCRRTADLSTAENCGPVPSVFRGAVHAASANPPRQFPAVFGRFPLIPVPRQPTGLPAHLRFFRYMTASPFSSSSSSNMSFRLQ